MLAETISSFLSRALMLDRRAKRLIFMSIDAVLCIAAVWLAFSLRLGNWTLWSPPILMVVSTALVLWLPIFTFGGVYKVIFRFAGSGTMLGLAKATIAYAVPMVAIFGLYSFGGVPRTISVLQPILFFGMLALSRIVTRYLLVDILHVRQHRGETRNVIIYGAGNSGQQLARSLTGEASMRLRAFIDDDSSLVGQRLNGFPVLSAQNLESDLERLEVTDILLAFPNVRRSERIKIIRRLSHLRVRVKMLPRISHVLDEKVSISDLRDVSIEDLLGRDAVAPSSSLLGATITGKVVLVTGAGGSIGGELCRQILAQGPARLVLAEISEIGIYRIEQDLRENMSAPAMADGVIIPELVNVADRSQMARIYRKWKPDTVFHAAAYKHVPLVESNPLSGMRNNIFGTLYSSLEAEAGGVSNFILISTDKAVRPTNVMGATKRACELVLQALAHKSSDTRFAMVRFGNVLGSSGSVVPRFQKQIQDGGPVTVTHKDITRYFMTIPEAAQLVIQAGAMADGGEVYVLDMGDSVRIVDLAESMINLSGLTLKTHADTDGDIEIIEVGLRPGEKLYEELLIGNNPEPTSHRKIMKANEEMIEWPRLEILLNDLNERLRDGDVSNSLALLQEMVPEYTPSHNS